MEKVELQKRERRAKGDCFRIKLAEDNLCSVCQTTNKQTNKNKNKKKFKTYIRKERALAQDNVHDVHEKGHKHHSHQNRVHDDSDLASTLYFGGT